MGYACQKRWTLSRVPRVTCIARSVSCQIVSGKSYSCDLGTNLMSWSDSTVTKVANSISTSSTRRSCSIRTGRKGKSTLRGPRQGLVRFREGIDARRRISQDINRRAQCRRSWHEAEIRIRPRYDRKIGEGGRGGCNASHRTGASGSKTRQVAGVLATDVDAASSCWTSQRHQIADTLLSRR